MACFPTGVAIVTAHETGDRPRGLTLSAFCAVSLDPPLVLVCVDKSSNTLPALRTAGGFTVNFLAGGREHLAVLYASKAEEKFDGIAWRRPEIAEGGPLAVQSTRETMRRGFADGAEAATERELTEQDWTRKTEDFKEGIKSYAEKRVGNFKGR